ncbi:MAG TPA: hypothetical protein VNV44_05025 [Solirubrobacteraceae bacterium]|nr:hypothetical protein [Solirubrobacteraceae bacterium]
MTRRARWTVALGAALAAAALGGYGAGGAGAETVYSNLPASLPANFASFGNEAYSMSEFGGMIETTSVGHKTQTVSVAMSAWGCQFGAWYNDTCETTKPSKTFRWPITLHIYEVGPSNSVGALIGSETRTFKLPYRPSRSPQCGTGAYSQYEKGTWYDSKSNACYHGLAFAITFKKLKLQVRKKEIVTVSYNTSHHGPAPVGETACNATVAGCYYDSLNVAIAEPSENTLTTGAQPTKSLYLDSTYAAMYCGGPTPVGTFGPTAPIEGSCASNSPYETEENIQPVISVVTTG